MAKTKSTNKKKSDPQNKKHPVTEESVENPSKMEESVENPSKMEESVENTSKMEESVENPNTSSKEGEHTKKDISSLRTLNALLVRETTENREEIKALSESKKFLESELTRVKLEVESLRDALVKVKEDEVENEVSSVFIESKLMREKEEVEKRLEEMKEEMGFVVKERDDFERLKFDGDLEIGAMKKKENEVKDELRREKVVVRQLKREMDEVKEELGARIDELNGLKERESRVVEELGELRVKCVVSAKAMKEKEEEIELMRRELSLMEKRCEVERLKGENKAVSRRNDELCDEKEKREVRVSELKDEVNKLNGVVLRAKADEEKWRLKVFELEECNAGLIAEVKRLKDDFSGLIKEKDDKEREVSRLESEKARVVTSLSGLEKEIKNAKRFHDEVVGEKNRLQGELDCIRGELSLVQESKRVEVEKSKKLASEIDDQRRALKQVTVERDDAKKELELEKKNGVQLQAKVSEISKKMEETAQVIDRLNASSDTLVGQKKEIEDKYNTLVEQKKLAEENNAKAKAKIAELNGLLKNKTVMFDSVLTMLKNTVKQMSMENENKAEVKLNEQGLDELNPIIAELEALRAVFKKRGDNEGEIQQEMKSLQCSLKEVNKKKSFWTLVSAATTTLAAVASYAYASKAR